MLIYSIYLKWQQPTRCFSIIITICQKSEDEMMFSPQYLKTMFPPFFQCVSVFLHHLASLFWKVIGEHYSHVCPIATASKHIITLKSLRIIQSLVAHLILTSNLLLQPIYRQLKYFCPTLRVCALVGWPWRGVLLVSYPGGVLHRWGTINMNL